MGRLQVEYLTGIGRCLVYLRKERLGKDNDSPSPQDKAARGILTHIHIPSIHDWFPRRASE